MTEDNREIAKATDAPNPVVTAINKGREPIEVIVDNAVERAKKRSESRHKRIFDITSLSPSMEGYHKYIAGVERKDNDMTPEKSVFFSNRGIGIKAGPSPRSVVIYNVETGEELKGVYSANINLCLDDVARAKVEIYIGEVEMEGILLEQVTFFENVTGKKFELVEEGELFYWKDAYVNMRKFAEDNGLDTKAYNKG